MRIRDVVLQDNVHVTNAGTWTFPVNLVDPVTEFKFWFRVRNHETGPNNNPEIPYLVAEVAVIDGSEVIQSMNAAEAIATYCFDHGEFPLFWLGDYGHNWQYITIPLTFGRTLTDQEYIFQPTSFRNPQLRITWDIAAQGAVGANSFEDDSCYISVWAKVMEEGATPRGYFMVKELEEFVTALTGDHITYLPVDFNIRKVYTRTYLAGGIMTEALDRFKISQDEDKWIPIDMLTRDLVYLMHNWFPEFATHGRGQSDDNEEREHYLGEYVHGKVCGGEDDHIVGASGFASNVYTLHCVDNAGSSETDCRHFWNAWGRTPFDSFCYPFGQQDDPKDWLNVGPIGNLRLILHQNTAGYTTQVWVQQAHPY